MKKFFALMVGLVVGAGAQASAQETALPQPEVAEISFSPDAAGTAVISTAETQKAEFLKSAKLTGGSVVATESGFQWTIAKDAEFGLGGLRLLLDRKKITGDLALVLDARLEEGSSIAIQLHDAAGGALALDLFGDVKFNAEAVGTNTFVVPLTKYPDAASVTLRRLSGPLSVKSLLAFPVLGEVAATDEAEKALADRLGETLSSHHRLRRKTEVAPTASIGALHLIPALDRINAIGAEALSAIGFPRYQRIAKGALEPQHISVSGTTYDFSQLLNRFLSLDTEHEVFDLFFTSSAGVFWYFLNDGEAADRPKGQTFGMGSTPMSEEDCAAFEKKHGFPIIQIPIGRNAIQVVVNDKNPLEEISVPQLDAVFGKELRTGAPARAIVWNDLGVDGKAFGQNPIAVFGGDPDWGTGKSFQKLVLKGGPWREDMTDGLDVVYGGGVEREIGRTVTGIGYKVLRPTDKHVKLLAISSEPGEPAYRPNAKTVYSGQYVLQRKIYAYVAAPKLSAAPPAVIEMVNLLLSDAGQTMIARSNSLPLTAEEVIAERAKLGLK